MSTAQKKEIARRFIQALGTAGAAVVDDLAAPDLTLFHPLLPEPLRGPAAYKALLTRFLNSFSGNEITVDDLLAEGDLVAVRWTWRGTHMGEFRGIPPTGKQVTTTGITLYRLAEGKVVEERAMEDVLGLLQQLGAIP